MTIRLGMIGCGHIGGIHSFALRALHRGGMVDAPLVATYDTDGSRAEAFAQAHGRAVVAESPGELLDAVDAVWICTPTSSHRSLVEAAAEAGVDIYCEKPLATTLDDARAMLAAVEAAGIRSQVGLVLRASPPIAAVQQLATDAEEMGRPMVATLRDDQYFPIQGQYGSTWRSDVALAGGGTLIEHSIHDLDVLSWILGPALEVTARTANFAGHAGIEDLATVTLTHGNGAVSSLVSVWHGVLSRPSTRRLEVFGERGIVWLDDDHIGPVHVIHDTSARVVDPMVDVPSLDQLELRDEWRTPLDMYLRADLAFLNALAEGRTPEPGLATAVEAHAVADACYRSAAAGGAPVEVGPARC